MKLTSTFPSRDNHFTLEYHVYEPTTPNNILIQIAHGMAEHKERYDGFCKYLCSIGFIVAISDHRGHCNSINDNHRHGDMGKNGFEEAVHDMHALTCLIKEKYKYSSCVLFGHSMGSLLARRYLALYGEELDALILTGTPSPQFGLRAAMALSRIVIALKGPKYQSPLLQKLAFGSFNKTFTNRTGLEWLNQNEDEVDAYVNDPWCGFVFSARSFYDLFGGMKKVFGSYPKPANPSIPILFLSGDEDPCGNMGRGVKACFDHLKKQGYENVSMKLYPKMRHEILLEINHQDVYEDVVRFILD